ncbi:unnamed protein product, partial [Adineta ricciae]
MENVRIKIQSNNLIKRSTTKLVKEFLELQEKFLSVQKATYERLETVKYMVDLSLDNDRISMLTEYKPLEEVQIAVCGYNSCGKTSFIHEVLGCGDFLPVGTGAVTGRIVKFSYAPPEQACLIKYVSATDRTQISDPIDLSQHFKSSTNNKSDVKALRKIVKEQLARPNDVGKHSDEFAKWARTFIEIRLPSTNLESGVHIYDTPGFLGSDPQVLRDNLLALVVSVRPTLVFLYDNSTGSDDTRKCYEQLKVALRSHIMGVDIFFLNTKVDVAVIQKDARQRDDDDDDDFKTLLNKERLRRYGELMEIDQMKNDVEHRNHSEMSPSFERCESFDIFSCLSPSNEMEKEMKCQAIDRIIRFAADHDLRVTKFITNIILSAIDVFFDFVLLTNRRTPDEWNNLRADALKRGEQFFEQYRCAIDMIAKEANQRLSQCFNEKKLDIEKRAIQDSETRDVRCKDYCNVIDHWQSIVSHMFDINFACRETLSILSRSKKHDTFQHEENFIDAIVESEVMKPIIQDIFSKQSCCIKKGLVADNILYRNKNELLYAAHWQVFLDYRDLNDNYSWIMERILELPLIISVYLVLSLLKISMAAALVAVKIGFSKNNNLDEKQAVLDQRKKKIQHYLVVLGSKMDKMGDHLKKHLLEWIDSNYEKFKEKVDLYHSVILRTMNDREKAYKLAHEFIPAFARIECHLAANLDMATHNGSHPIINRNEVEGEGGYFTVHPASWDNDDQLVAKSLKQHCTDPNFAYLEGHFHRAVTNLNVPHIIHLKYLFIDNDVVNLIMPRYSANLKSFLEKNMKDMNADKAIEISRNVASVIAHMHAYDLVHRDIKAENILIDEQEHVYLADYGTCQHGTENHTIVGTVPFPPDINALMTLQSSSSNRDHLQTYQGSAVDVYLLGGLMFVCAPKENYSPASDANPEQVKRLDRHKVPESYCQLILRCLHKDWKKRPTAKEIVDELDSIAKELCMICQEKPRFRRCLPCQHKTMCEECYAKLLQQNNEVSCIICRQAVTAVQDDNNSNT